MLDFGCCSGLLCCSISIFLLRVTGGLLYTWKCLLLIYFAIFTSEIKIANFSGLIGLYLYKNDSDRKQ